MKPPMNREAVMSRRRRGAGGGFSAGLKVGQPRDCEGQAGEEDDVGGELIILGVDGVGEEVNRGDDQPQ